LQLLSCVRQRTTRCPRKLYQTLNRLNKLKTTVAKMLTPIKHRTNTKGIEAAQTTENGRLFQLRRKNNLSISTSQSSRHIRTQSSLFTEKSLHQIPTLRLLLKCITREVWKMWSKTYSEKSTATRPSWKRPMPLQIEPRRTRIAIGNMLVKKRSKNGLIRLVNLKKYLVASVDNHNPSGPWSQLLRCKQSLNSPVEIKLKH
jgi:hypothetical protein